MSGFHLLNDIKLLNEFNLQMSTNATLIHQTNFGDDLYDHWEWSFYEKTSSKNVYNLVGFCRKGNLFDEERIEGFTSALDARKPTVEVYPIALNEAVGQLYSPWYSRFQKRWFYKGFPNEFDRYWIDEESLIQDKFPDKWEKINQLCLREIKRLAHIGKSKDYKSAWVYHKYKDTNLTEIINNLILRDTCFYYSSEIFYHRFSSPFMYSSSKERKEFDGRHYDY